MAGHSVSSWRRGLLSFFVAAGMAVAMPSAARADDKSIFDDDWTSPSQKKTPTATPSQPKPPTPSPTNPQPPAPQPSTTKPPAPPPVGPQPVKPAPPPTLSRPPTTVTPPAVAQKAIPPAAKLENSRKLLKDAFARQLADSSPKARLNLSDVLLNEAFKAGSDPSDQYVLFSGALNAAREAGDLRQVSAVARKFAEAFSVDSSALMANAAGNMSLKGDTPARTTENVTLAMELLDTLVMQGDLIGASRVCAALRPAVAADKALAGTVTRRAQEVEALRIAKDRIAPSFTRLSENPADPAANFAVGAFTCFSLGNWQDGLPLLAKGSDPTTKALAALELAKPKTAAEDLALADGWWEVAEHQPAPSQTVVQRHAAEWYTAAGDGLSPLQKLKVEKRLAELKGKAAPVSAPVAAPVASAERMLARLKGYPEQLWNKAGAQRTAIAGAEPLGGDVMWSPKSGPSTISDKVTVGQREDKKNSRPALKGKLQVAPGFMGEGGSIVVADGVLEIAGEPGRPVVFKNTHFFATISGRIKASNAVFENCTFSKASAWYSDFTAKFELNRCLLIGRWRWGRLEKASFQ